MFVYCWIDTYLKEIHFENFIYFQHCNYEHERSFFWGCHLECEVNPVLKGKSSNFSLFVSHRRFFVWSSIDTHLNEICFQFFIYFEHFSFELDKSFFWAVI